MHRSDILAKLASREPLFTAFPYVPHRRIMGTESEYGSDNNANADALIYSGTLPRVLPNGGEIYRDNHHIEYASPETADPVSATAFYEAGKVLCWNGSYSAKLYCNNNDWHGVTFGSHENYFTQAPPREWSGLVPYLIARMIMCGNGWVMGDGTYSLSQRAHHITQVSGTETMINRGIINFRNESLAHMPGWDRLHLICGDANMAEGSTFLRLGVTSLMVQMLELGALPETSYDASELRSDLSSISTALKGWQLKGITKGPAGAVDLLGMYLERAESLFSHCDPVTDAVLAIWRDTLDKLASDPMVLWARLDWVLKLTLLQAFKDETGITEPVAYQSQDMEYHSLDPASGLYYGMRDQCQLERIVSTGLIEHAMRCPPSNTRAHARGMTVTYLANRKHVGLKVMREFGTGSY